MDPMGLSCWGGHAGGGHTRGGHAGGGHTRGGHAGGGHAGGGHTRGQIPVAITLMSASEPLDIKTAEDQNSLHLAYLKSPT
jgi:hypothetical protein